MVDLLLITLLAYLLGNVLGGRVVGALRGGVDLRHSGSGNPGAANALRTQGAVFALGVLAIDVCKGVLAVTVLPALPAIGPPMLSADARTYLSGIAVTLGHCYPVVNGFRGGKGVATLAGVFGALLTQALGWILGVFVLTVIASGYVSLGTLAAAVTALAYVALHAESGLASAMGGFTLTMAALVIWTHRANIRRLWRGTEHRFEKARVWLRWRRH